MWEHHTWGNRLQIFSWENRKIVGWLGTKPENGDKLHIKMQSGKIAEFEILNVKHCHDPPDMFFADIKDIRYIDNEGD
jgi:hypothetical protein